MTQREEIKAKADELGQFYFPDECNVWARENIEAKFVSSACIKMVEWMKNAMLEKAWDWFYNMALDYMSGDITDVKWGSMKEDFFKAMEK